MTRIPIIMHDDLPQCERCGCLLASPGLCASCAEGTTEVEKVTLVSVEIPEDKVLVWSDLMEEQ